MGVMTKTERVTALVEKLAAEKQPGGWIGSVDSIGSEVGASTGTVIEGIRRAQQRGVPVVVRRGPDGGYYKATVRQRPAAAAAREAGVGLDVVLGALEQARGLHGEVAELIRTLEQALP